MEPEMKDLLDAARCWRDASRANKKLLNDMRLAESSEDEERQERSFTKLHYAELRLVEAVEAVELIQSAEGIEDTT